MGNNWFSFADEKMTRLILKQGNGIRNIS